jgi:hypothetical protein
MNTKNISDEVNILLNGLYEEIIIAFDNNTDIKLNTNNEICNVENNIIDTFWCAVDYIFNDINDIQKKNISLKEKTKLYKQKQHDIDIYLYTPIQKFINKHIKTHKHNEEINIKKTFQLSTFKKNIDPMLKQFYYTFQQKKDEQKYNKNILGMNANIWGYIGILTNGLSAGLQMYTLYKTKSAKSFSMPFIYIMTFLNAVYFLIGIIEQNIGLTIATAFFVIYNFTVIYTYMTYK